MQTSPKRTRIRGVILTPTGLRKLQLAKLQFEEQENFGEKYTYEQLSELTNLDLNTIKKVLEGKQGVDKRSLEKFCWAFKLELLTADYSKPKQIQHHDWGGVVTLDYFVGRSEELETLSQWLLRDRCRIITLLGMGGIGKTTLSIKLAQQSASDFDCVIWKSLRDSPPIEETIAALIEFLSAGTETAANLPSSLGKKISRLLEHLRNQRCLILLDNTESLMDGHQRAGKYRQECAGYGELIRRIGSTAHNSCLILTTREKPKEIAVLEGDQLPVRSWQLTGLKEGQEIIKQKGLTGSKLELSTLSDRYNGNPLALKVVAATIRDLFGGDISEFLSQDQAVFGDIRDLLDQQFERLSALEQEIMYWITIAREPVSLERLQANLVFEISMIKLLESIESLSRRSLVEQNEALFSHQSVVMEYLTSRLVEQVAQEIINLQPQLLCNHALIKASAKDYIRENQIRLLLQPLINQLLTVLRSKKAIAENLQQILRLLQSSPLEKGYGAGNIINLLGQMEIDLTGYNFSNLCVWQADLRKAQLHQVNFANADLSNSIFAENFGGVWSVAFSPNGEYLAAGDTKGNILLRRVVDGQPIRNFSGHHAWIVSLAFSPDGNTLASSSCDCTAKLWDVNTGQCLHSLEEHEQEVWSVAFNPAGEILATGCDDGKIRIWDLNTGRCIQAFQDQVNEIHSVIFSLNGLQIISGSQDGKIRIWDLNTGKCTRILDGHQDGVRSVCISYDGQILASGSNDQTVRLWNLSTGDCLKVLLGHANVILAVAFSPRSNLLASSSFGHKIRLWDIETGECLKVFLGHSNLINSLDFEPQGNILASGSYDQSVKLWNVVDYQCVKTWQGFSNQSLSVTFSDDGQRLISGGQDQKIKVWNVETGTVIKTLHGHTNWVYSVALSPKHHLLASSSGDQSIKLWNLETGQVVKTLRGHEAVVRSVVFSADGKILASGSEDGTAIIWDLTTDQPGQILKGHQAEIWSITLNPDGQILASASCDQTVKLWDVQSGQCLHTIDAHTSWVWSVAFSPDQQIFVTTSGDQTIRFWDLANIQCQKILQEEKGHSQLVIFSPDGQIIATYNGEHNIKLWQVSTGKCVQILRGHTALINSMAFNPDGHTLVSSSEDETIKLWNLTSGECSQTLKPTTPYDQMNIQGITGLSQPTIETLKFLGALNQN